MSEPSTKTRTLTLTGAAIAFTLAIAMVICWYLELREIRRILIFAASTAYVLTAFLAHAHRTNFGRLLLIGVACAWIGDMVGPSNFIAGAIAFLVGHFFYMGAFIVHSVSWRYVAVGLVIYGAITAGLMAYIFPEIPPQEQAIIGAYTGVLAVMGGVALGTRGVGATWIMTVAGALFYVSDYFLAQTAFLEGGFINTALGYPMYYAAVILFAITPAFDAPRKSAIIEAT